MEAKTWMESFGNIDESYLEEAMQAGAHQTEGVFLHRKRVTWMRYAGIGAALAAVCTAICITGHYTDSFRLGGNRPGGKTPITGALGASQEDKTKQDAGALPENHQEEDGAILQTTVCETAACEVTPDLPVLVFEERVESMSPENDIALPEGYFLHDMTEGEIASIWGQEELSWEGIAVADTYLLTGKIIYDGNGTVWEATICGYENEEAKEQYRTVFSLEISPDHLPPECVVYDTEKTTCQIWGTDVEAFFINGCAWNSENEEYGYTYYCSKFIREGKETVGVKAEMYAYDGQEEEIKELMNAMASQSLRPEAKLQLSQLAAEDIPEWRSDRLTEEEAAKEGGMAAYLPAALPERFVFDGCWRELGQDRNYMTVQYRDKNIFIDWSIDKMRREDVCVDIAVPESYDKGCYEKMADVPEEYWDSVQNPLFAIEDVTLELLKRIVPLQDGEEPEQILFGVKYPDGTVVEFSGYAQAQEIYDMLPKALNAEKVLSEANNRLGSKLTAALAADGKNVFISPYSIAAALSMVTHFSEDNNAVRDLVSFLGYDGYGDEELAVLQGELKNRLEVSYETWDRSSEDPSKTKTGKTKIANILYLDEEFPLAPEFDTLKERLGSYEAPVKTAKLAEEEFLQEVNGWVRENTDGMIEEILDRPFAKDVVLALLNAVSFEGIWQSEFDPVSTIKQTFFAPGGELETDMMRQRSSFLYAETEEYQVIYLPYLEGYGMYVYLPKDDALRAKWTDEAYLEQLTKPGNYSFEEKEVILALPKFELEYEAELSGLLRQFGLTRLYDLNVYERLSETPVKLDRIIHKTALKNDEQGTKAAAVTMIAMAEGAAAETEPPIEMTVDHPFVFTVTQEDTGAHLFEGILVSPGK